MRNYILTWSKEKGEKAYAWESLKEDGVFLIPDGHTTVEPPLVANGFVLQFNENTLSWDQIQDHRGEVWYDQDKEVVIDQIGPIPSGLTPKPVERLPTQSEMIEYLIRLRKENEVANVKVDDITFSANAESRMNLLISALEAERDSSYAVSWKSVNGFVDIDAPTILKASREVKAYVESCFEAERKITKEIENNKFQTYHQVKKRFFSYLNDKKS